jgi:hypothetical protein
MAPPRLSFAAIDWAAAFATLGDETVSAQPPGGGLRPIRGAARRAVPPVLARLNATVSRRFPGVGQSPVPVLLPFDADGFGRDLAEGALAGDERYLFGFHTRTFFSAGPSGYDAAFALRVADVAEFADITFSRPYEIHVSGSALVYELEDHRVSMGSAVPALEAEFPGIRRLLHEHHLRFTFVRFGVPYVVSIGCFDAGIARYRFPTCRSAERVATRFLRALRVVGGTPQPRRALDPPPIERPQTVSSSFTYHPPGRLLPGTGFRGLDGRPDITVYSQIRFPLAKAPAFVNSQMFQRRNKPTMAGQSPNYSYPWRDNFCERRGFPVGQCPAGAGHQGQDIRGPQCTPDPVTGRCRPHHDLVAVRDGTILRAPAQEALYLVVNTAREHLRFRYLHMHPRKMDEDRILSGRPVHEGEVIAQIGNFDGREGGTSYHLHFDIQVPTRNGWVFVNPYMTLVAAYERLIGGRGEPTADPIVVASVDAIPMPLPRPLLSNRTVETKAAKRRIESKIAKKRVETKVAKRPQVQKRTALKHKTKPKKHRVARN